MIPFELSPVVKQKTGDWGNLFLKIGAMNLKMPVFNTNDILEVQNKREIYAAHIGSQDGKERYYQTDYDQVCCFYAKSRGIKETEELIVAIRDGDKEILIFTGVHADKSGLIKVNLDWNKIKQKLKMRKVHAVVKNNNNEIIYDGSDLATGFVNIYKKAALLKLAEYKSAVWVEKTESAVSKTGVCECEARVRAFMRMLRKGEGTQGESGYTKQFGGKVFTDMSTHPQEIIHSGNYYSSAAGAYQIMGYTYYWLNGEKLNDKNKKAGVYEEEHDYIKKYKIKDFSSESQDKLCLIILKHKRPGSLSLIIKNEIKEALEKYGSYEWASLPPGRYGQPTQTIDGAIKEYNRCLKEELAGKTNLYIKKGFLKEFGYECCNDNKSEEVSNCNSCGKKHVDLRTKVKWQTQFDSKWGNSSAQNSACKKTCDDILINSGLAATSLSRLFQTAIENDTHTKLIIDVEVAKKGIAYLDGELEKGNPVQVGVNHNLNYKINNNSDHSTDHFIVIVGKSCIEKKIFYTFYDVGTKFEKKGASDDNCLYLDISDYSLKGKTVYNGNFYTVTQIRKN